MVAGERREQEHARPDVRGLLAKVQQIAERLAQDRFDDDGYIAGSQRCVRNVPLGLLVGAHQPPGQLLAGSDGTAQGVIGEGAVRVGEQPMANMGPCHQRCRHRPVQFVKLVEHRPSVFLAPAACRGAGSSYWYLQQDLCRYPAFSDLSQSATMVPGAPRATAL